MRLDDRVLVGGLVAGGLWLVPMLFLAWPVTLVGGAYVVVASVFLAAAYGRRPLARRQELLVWVAPWLLLVAWWLGVFWLTGGDDPEGEGVTIDGAVWAGAIAAVLATICFLIWQLTALAVREVLRWFEPDDDDDAGVSG